MADEKKPHIQFDLDVEILEFTPLGHGEYLVKLSSPENIPNIEGETVRIELPRSAPPA